MMVDPLGFLIQLLVSSSVITLPPCPRHGDLPQLESLGDVQLAYLVILVGEVATLQLTWLKHLREWCGVESWRLKLFVNLFCSSKWFLMWSVIVGYLCLSLYFVAQSDSGLHTFLYEVLLSNTFLHHSILWLWVTLVFTQSFIWSVSAVYKCSSICIVALSDSTPHIFWSPFLPWQLYPISLSHSSRFIEFILKRLVSEITTVWIQVAWMAS